MCLSRPAYVLHNEHVGLRVILIIVTLTSWLSSSQGLLSQGAGLTARGDLARNLCYNDMHCRLEALRQNSRAKKAENNKCLWLPRQKLQRCHSGCKYYDPARYRCIVKVQAMIRGWLFRHRVLYNPHTEIRQRFLMQGWQHFKL